MEVDYVQYGSRAGRTQWVAERYRPLLAGRVLDVGCDRRVLPQLVEGLDYVGVDAGGTPDLVLDLEATDRLPFDDRDFDVVLCCDVLEHLDSLHRTFDELVRVARGHLILSLPNCWAAARQPVERGRGSIGHYGLPAERPVDRHKWFFSLSEGRDFLLGQARRHGLEVVDLRAAEKPRPALVRGLRRLRHPAQERYLNRFAHTVWTVLKRPAGA